MQEEILIIDRAKIDPMIKDQIDTEINAEFGHVPIVQKYKWANPKWSVVVQVDDFVLSFLNIIDREVLFDDQKVKVAGINNVITPKKNRGKGYAHKTMTLAQKFMFETMNASYGLLLCADDLIERVRKFGGV